MKEVEEGIMGFRANKCGNLSDYLSTDYSDC